MSTSTSVKPALVPSRSTRSFLNPRWLPIIVLALVLIVFSTQTHGFYSLDNAKVVINSASIVGIIAVGVTAIVLGGRLFSLSVGTTVAICAMFFLYSLRVGMVLAILLTLLLGVVVLALQGWLVGRLRANPIIVTIGAGALQEGVVTWVTGGVSVYPPAHGPSYGFLAAPLFGLPFPVYVFVVVAVLGEIVRRRTVFGRQIMLMGESLPAARASALPITRLTTMAFAAAGLTAAVAGVLLGAFNQSGTLTTTGTLTYDSIAAVLVGGTAVTGGTGSVLRSAVGALVIAAIEDMLLLRGYSSPVALLVLGVIVACVVVVNHLTRRAKEAS
ncbi:ABC transporter permease [Allobranchiibius sp. GilTou38]|uniref:ABC transporter permease n=1 Tax=Allobranchiibius sp. GilTou38 TaxID=2815210 RepID=UPI001AA187F1|nr:ABC transporter permease [Allobranchiibius sp. GilTou38]MBO1766750.1 ABC transporter permease [Allobranchiibius sp. GilTou38]